MSDKSSSPESTRSAADIRQDIADYILSHPDELSDVPSVKQFVEEHGRLTNEIAAAKKRGKRLAKAKEKYEPLEQRVVAGRQELKDAEAELAKSHRPLGEASFQAFLSGELEDHPVFADRLAAHKRVQELQQERDGLAPAADAGLAQKAKAKAQQLAVMAKIKIEEMKLGGLETEIGRKAVEGKLDESVRCNSTNEHLGRIAEQRGTVTECALKLREADTLREKAAKQLCEAVPLPHIESSKTFDTEIKACKATVRGSESALSKAMCLLTDELDQPHVTSIPDAMAQQIKELREASQHDVSERMRNAGDQMRKRGAGLLSGVATDPGIWV